MSRVTTATLSGVDGIAIEVEVRLSSQLPRIDIVGLPEASVRESAARVRAAIAASGRSFPPGRITVNLAPASLRKAGAAFDLAIAVGILAAQGELEGAALEKVALLGELALDGRLRPVRGALALCLAARDAGCESVIMPSANASTAAAAPGIIVRGAAHLGEVLEHLAGHEALPETRGCFVSEDEEPGEAGCVSEVRGQEHAKRALLISAAGGHGLLLSGPPGSGKTMLASRLPSLLPSLGFEDALESARIHGVLSGHSSLRRRPPFRAPHHSASAAGMLGGGSPVRPGEVSLAHRGVLFLDELPEFDRRCLEALRQVLETREIKIARAAHAFVFPADFLLVAACNPCPCGWYRSEGRDCRCDDAAIERYRRRLSGPLLDRLDLHVEVRALRWRELARNAEEASDAAWTSEALRERVEACRAAQRARGVRCNAVIPDPRCDALVDADSAARALLGDAVDRWGLSARAAGRVLRIARTIADLASEERVGADALAEALSYRGEVAAPR